MKITSRPVLLGLVIYSLFALGARADVEKGRIAHDLAVGPTHDVQLKTGQIIEVLQSSAQKVVISVQLPDGSVGIYEVAPAAVQVMAPGAAVTAPVAATPETTNAPAAAKEAPPLTPGTASAPAAANPPPLPASGPPVASEEFVGPLPGWRNLRTDFGAVGDGKTDDTAALEAGLNALVVFGKGKPGDPYVLYLPAGQYRITKPLVLINRTGISIQGEDPTTTSIIYDGPPGQSILTLNAVRYSKFGRITWDGQGKALAAVAHQWMPNNPVGPSATYLEHADEVFKNVERGLIGGLIDKGNHGMDAECTVKRCKFINCSEAGLSIESMNALDWWVWDSEFVDCATGAQNWHGGGHFHIYRSIFRRSKVADIRIAVGSYFGIRYNTSIGSNRFFDPGGGLASIVGNKVINPTSPTPIIFPSFGPVVLLDNIFVQKTDVGGPVVHVCHPAYASTMGKGGGDVLAFGNKFYGADGIATPNLVGEDNQTLDYADAKPEWSNPVLPPIAPRTDRKIFPLAPGASAAEIQAAIDQAAALTGQKAVVYLPAGAYRLEKTLHLPANSDLQLIGDGCDTLLIWEGDNGGTEMEVAGPTRVTLRDFYLTALHSNKNAKPARGIVFTNVDQPGGLIFLDQATGSDCHDGGMFFDSLAHTRVEAIG